MSGGVPILFAFLSSAVTVYVLYLVTGKFMSRLEHGNTRSYTSLGGILIIPCVCVCVVSAVCLDGILSESVTDFSRLKLFAGLFSACGVAIPYLCDDYLKKIRKVNTGLGRIIPPVGIFLVAAVYVFTMIRGGADFIFVPFCGNLGGAMVYCLVSALVIPLAVESVRVYSSDEKSGDNSAFIMFACLLVLSFVRKSVGGAIFAGALCGVFIALKLLNFDNEKILTGCGGKVFVGFSAVAVCYMIDSPWLFMLCGLPYIREATGLLFKKNKPNPRLDIILGLSGGTIAVILCIAGRL